MQNTLYPAHAVLQAKLNERLKRCARWEELSALLDANTGTLDFVNVSTLWVRLATLYDVPKAVDTLLPVRVPPAREPAFRQFLAQLIAVTAAHLRFFGIQALSNVMWAMSNADWQLEQHGPAVEELVHEWCDVVYEHLDELRAPDVSNISTAVGRLDDRWRPDFVVAFYRAVLRRGELLEALDATALNNLLYGISRAHRRGLSCVGPSTRKLLAGCVKRLLSPGRDAEALRLVPWRAAQLLYNCYKLSLRIGPDAYAVLMPLVAQVYTQEPSPLDRWSLSFLTGFVVAHQRVKPQQRPDVRPLYAYVERRLGEATSSQMGMLSHSFAEMGCAPAPPFWGQVFSRYLQGGQQGLTGQLLLPQPHPPQLPRPLVLAQLPGPPHLQHRTRPYHTLPPSQQQGQLPHDPQQEAAGVAPGLPRDQQLYPRPRQRQREQPARAQEQPTPSPPPSQQPQPPGEEEARLPSGGLQQGPAAEQAQPQAVRPHVAPSAHGPGRTQGPAAAEERTQGQQLEARDLQAVAADPQQPPALSNVTRQPFSSQPLSQPTSQPTSLCCEHHDAAPSGGSHSAPRHQLPMNGHERAQPEQELPQAPPKAAQPQPPPGVHLHVGPKHRPLSYADDRSEARTLHYLCWQAAKAGILPPRAFLRLYVVRVPPWLERHADDRQLAQAVETLQLLRWVPRRDVREALKRALARRAPTSPLPLRRLLRWLEQQR
ncbi:hypothetical protein GPECTOR_127g530 [Gonium pectorale]|uniref:Uncharacterized protein n=1 Tax=Gonium pectorale TaxID=33097 RepID=A0A150FYG9_GONPE|nr:hypothetical protein GPECTOR_127g530 [Gonium pectorale]|eukprot:KXZ42652.1 hypothetical protein GPECTOR_127g530 [Gonium pectorale]